MEMLALLIIFLVLSSSSTSTGGAYGAPYYPPAGATTDTPTVAAANLPTPHDPNDVPLPAPLPARFTQSGALQAKSTIAARLALTPPPGTVTLPSKPSSNINTFRRGV